jgi:hypothetical protein
MGKNPLFIALLVVFDGGAVAWAAWEFWKLRPNKEDEAAKSSALARAAPEPTSPETAGHPEGEHGAHDG